MTIEEFWTIYGSDLVAVALAFLSALFAFLARRRISKVSRSVDQVSTDQKQANAVLQAVEQKLSSGGSSNVTLASALQTSGQPEVQCDGIQSEVGQSEKTNIERRNLAVTNFYQNYEIQLSVALKGSKASVSVKVHDLVDGHELTAEEIKDLIESISEYSEVK